MTDLDLRNLERCLEASMRPGQEAPDDVLLAQTGFVVLPLLQ